MIPVARATVLLLVFSMRWHPVVCHTSAVGRLRHTRSSLGQDLSRIGPPGLGLDDVLAAVSVDDAPMTTASALHNAVAHPPHQSAAALTALQRKTSGGTSAASAADSALSEFGSLQAELGPSVDEYDVVKEDDRGGGEKASVDVADKTTMEDVRRQATGDVTPVVSAAERRARHTPRHRPAKHVALPSKASSSTTHKSSSLPAQNRMQSQCLQFAQFIAKEGVHGQKFVRAWKSTCQYAVDAGVATPAYTQMCTSLGGAVERFANDLNASPESVCEAVIQTMKATGVGSSPVLS